MKHYSNIRTLLLGLICTLTLFSCGKDKDKDSGKAKIQLLTTGNWKVTSWTSNPAMDWDYDGDTETDMMVLFENCQLDDYVTFKADGTGENNDGSSRCDPTDPQTSPFEWALMENDSKIEIDGDEYEIVELTSSVFKVKQNIMMGNTSVAAVMTFTH